jgi:hypothetical protein
MTLKTVRLKTGSSPEYSDFGFFVDHCHNSQAQREELEEGFSAALGPYRLSQGKVSETSPDQFQS